MKRQSFNSVLLIAPLLAISACSSEPQAEKLKREYDMMKRAGAGADELCEQGRKIQQAYLEAGEEEEDYRLQRLVTDQTCLSADLDRRLGL